MVVASGEYSVVLWWFGKMARNTTVGGILGLRMFSKIFQIILSHSFKVTGQSVFVVQSQSQCAKGRFQKTWTIPSSHSSKIRTGYYKLSTLNPFLTNQTKHVRANFNRVGSWDPSLCFNKPLKGGHEKEEKRKGINIGKFILFQVMMVDV